MKKKKKSFEIDDRIDIILRSTLRAVVSTNRGSDKDKNYLLDVIAAVLIDDNEWKAFKESFRSAVQNEAEQVLAEIKTNEARLNDELERQIQSWEKSIKEVKREKEKWLASSEAFKEIQSLIQLVDTVFQDEVDCGLHRLECKKAIFNRVISKLDEKEAT